MTDPVEEPTMLTNKDVEDDDVSERQVVQTASSKRSRITKAQSSGMESSILRFKNINFTVGKGDKQKYILRDISGRVKWGHVLAIMGPSGAGKTVLIGALTLDAFFGRPSGVVTLNGVPMTDHIFKSHCYVVVQKDKHWPYLTCRETLCYAAELYAVADKADIPELVDGVIEKMGLTICADTRNARLSGGQARRLSIGMALLKQPTLLFLDEPTSGLDAAAAENIMQEIVRVAKDERLIILCTIHQPSTKVYNGFDEVMILSKGREAYSGDVKDATAYFHGIGHPMPPQMNPAEHFLDLVNADFSDDAAVDRILDTWEEKRPEASSSHHKKGFDDDKDGQEGVVEMKKAPFRKELVIQFRRALTLIIRDPILYTGRAVVFLVTNILFSLVYLEARKYTQDQAASKLWITMWHIGVPSNLGAVAVYVLNEEVQTILRECKNGMVTPFTYVMTKTIFVVPIMLIFAVFALGIPTFAIMDFPASAFGFGCLLWATVMFVFECVAECLSIWCDDPILGMLQYMNFWFAAFLFGGFLLPKRDLFWPFKLFYYVMPFSYYIRSQMYNLLIHTDWESCDPTVDTESQVCVENPTGATVLNQLGLIYDIVGDDDTRGTDLIAMLAIALFYKGLYIAGVIMKAQKVAKIYPTTQ